MKKLLLAVLAIVLALPGVASANGSGSSGPWGKTDAVISVHDASVIEGDGHLVFEVTIDEAVDRHTWAIVALRSGSAKRWKDFKAGWRFVKIPAGETSTTVTVKVIDDDKAERDEQMRVKIGWTNAKRGDHRADGVIYDDDSKPWATKFELDILHANDHHSHLTDSGFDFFIDGEEVDIELGEFSRMVTAFDTLESELGPDANVAKVHAGDAITGTLKKVTTAASTHSSMYSG